jgi:hypothetical protein
MFACVSLTVRELGLIGPQREPRHPYMHASSLSMDAHGLRFSFAREHGGIFFAAALCERRQR